ncbi:MAG TPA: sulfurtransferase, partial [Rubrivivax sp.]|nr:sulfurtransferase [Rubrivivax sp.]
MSSVAEPVSIVAGYRFVDVHDGPALRDQCLSSARSAGIKGTLLIAPEGINFTVAGRPAAIAGWLQGLRSDPRFADIELKQHQAGGLPFARLRVKLKSEIIRMNQPGIRPGAGR